jgi:uncharacterized protein YodC (DUF2158 family)
VNDFKAGDVVQLVSGGPKMAVKSIAGYYGTMSVWCEWFDEKNKPQEGRFALTSIKLAND